MPKDKFFVRGFILGRCIRYNVLSQKCGALS